MDEKNEVCIIAKNKEQFNELEKKLLSLPLPIRAQLAQIYKGFGGFEGLVNESCNKKVTIIVPEDMTQILNFDGFILVYGPTLHLRITLHKHVTNKIFDFVIYRK